MRLSTLVQYKIAERLSSAASGYASRYEMLRNLLEAFADSTLRIGDNLELLENKYKL